MIKTFRLLAVCISLFTYTVSSGCAKLNTGASSRSLVPLSLSQTEQNLSDWGYDSPLSYPALAKEAETVKQPEPEDIWERIRFGFQLDEGINKRIQQELDWYSKHPSYMSRVSKRGSKYLYYIVEELDKRNMPMELALLPIVESAFDPFAYSHGRASGMWQIIPGTGKMLGLKQNWWYDGRRDVVASTDAALDYLQKLHKQFDGDWILALAAYNSGAGNVRKASRKNREKGRPTDYWSLHLPKETEDYVPRLLAIKALVDEPYIHDMELYPVPNSAYFKQVDIGSQIDLAQAAELADISMDDFYGLNPGYNRWATDPSGPHHVLVPIEKADLFKQQLAAMPSEQRVTWDRYTIKSGDSLSTIAKHYKTTMKALQSVNDIDGTKIRAGKTLLVPVASANATHYAYSLPQRIKKKQSRGKGHKVKYTVRSGDSLWTISRHYKTTSSKLAKWNGMAPADPIRPGQTLVIWSKTAKTTSNGSGVVRKVSYKVRKGDSLARIAGKFNLRISDILQWNQVNPKKYIQPGDSLTLFVDVKRIN